MSLPLSDPDLSDLQNEARSAARRLVRRLRMSAQDLDDVRQDLLVDLLARLKHFDHRKGTIGAFASAVMANRATRIGRRVGADRRMFGSCPVSLDAPVPDGRGELLRNVVAENDGYPALMGQRSDGFEASDRRSDLDRALGTLCAPDIALLADLMARGTAPASTNPGMSRASLYRRLGNIRLDLVMAGLDPAS
jgi:RNA polymerase sigma-70 factor (ECF subfamily)